MCLSSCWIAQRIRTFGPLFFLLFVVAQGRTVQAENVVVVTQTVAGPGDMRVNIAAQVGSGHIKAGLLTLDTTSYVVADTSLLPILPTTEFGMSQTRSGILSAINRQAHTLAAVVAAPLEAWMHSNGADAALFKLLQTVQVSGVVHPVTLSWHLLLQAGARIQYGDAEIIDSQTGPIEVSYVSLAVTSGLPAAFAYPNAGKLLWRQLNRQLVALDDWKIINVQGAYDEPVNNTGITIDPDFGLYCLENRQAGAHCPVAPDVQELLDQTGAPYALLDYLRELKPVYKLTQTDNGSWQQVARAVISVDYRQWGPHTCTAGSYRNSGTYSVMLESRTERYRVEIGGAAHLVDVVSRADMSPRVPFDVTRTNLTNQSQSAIADFVVDLDNPEGPLRTVAATPGLVQLAPVTTTGVQPASFLIADLYFGWCGRAIALSASCRPDGNIDLVIGGGAGVDYCARSEDMFTAQSWVLVQGQPLQNQWYHGGDRIPAVQWSYDGANNLTFARSYQSIAWQGGYIAGMQTFAATAFFSNFGFVDRKNFPSGGPINFWFEGSACPAGSLRVGQFTLLLALSGDPGTTCLDPAGDAGPIFGCQIFDDVPQCSTYVAVEPIWQRSQTMPWYPCDLVCTLYAGS